MLAGEVTAGVGGDSSGSVAAGLGVDTAVAGNCGGDMTSDGNVPGMAIIAWHLGQRAFFPAESSGTRKS